ncbi:unnamed protein product, partial [Meganyctiphanes norvegica]
AVYGGSQNDPRLLRKSIDPSTRRKYDIGMENSPLNQAHREQRRAEAHIRAGRLDEAGECHAHAAALLTQALTLTVTPVARESIVLQHTSHLRQQQLLRFRSQQHVKYMKAVENQRRKMGSVSGSGGSSSGGVGSGGMFRENTPPSRGSFRRTESLTAEISKNTEKFNSLLLMLIPEEEEEDCKDKGNEKPGKYSHDKEDVSMESEPKKEKEKSTDLTLELENKSNDNSKKAKCESATGVQELLKERAVEASVAAGVKKEKDMVVIVEELQTLRDHQNDLISQLLAELSRVDRENTQLKAQVRDLQSKCDSYEAEQRHMRAMADSSCSPFVFSPLSENSPDTTVPELAPLELPPLDFMDNV